MVESGNDHLENKTFIIIAYTLTLRAMNAREVTQFQCAPHRLYATQDTLDKLVISSTMCS